MTKQDAAALLVQLYADYSVLCSKYGEPSGDCTAEAVTIAVQALHEVEKNNAGKQKAHWQWFDEELGNPIDGYDRDWGYECSHCGYVLPDDFDNPDCIPKYRYCMNCGAEMFSSYSN